MWTKKHDEFAMSCKLRPSTRLMLRWILRRAKLNEICEIEIDLRKFNQWIAKQRDSEYDRKTIKEAIAQLDEFTQGMIVFMKSYSPWVHKIIVRPLNFVLEQKPQTLGKPPTPPTGNPMFDAERKQRVIEQQQQDISKLDSLLKKIGLNYTQDALLRLWRYAGKSFEEIQTAIELMLSQNSSEALYSRSCEPEPTIRNPYGWLVSCLRYGWQKGFNLYYDSQLPYFRYAQDIEKFVTDSLFQAEVCQT